MTTTEHTQEKLSCIICKSKLLKIADNLRTASSRADKLYPLSIYKCSNCSHVQKDVNVEYQNHLEDVYKTSYTLPGGGKKTNIVNGNVVCRESNIANYLTKFIADKSDVSVLDVGTGSGYLLKAFSEIHPGFKLAGFDITNEKEALIRENGATNFYHESLERIEERFDVITLNHVAEHLPSPVETLRQATALLKPQGIILVIVPCFELVYSDFFFLEHCSHFTESSLNTLAAFSGLSIVDRMEGVLGSIEIGFIAKDAKRKPEVNPVSAIAWANALPPYILENKKQRTLGVFGLNGVGMWLGAMMKGDISFFVDDDPAKQGSTFAECPIISVTDIPTDSVVIVAFNNPSSSIKMSERLAKLRPDIEFISPPNPLS
ncbi:methyltransferase domain-containing protein [Herbaspirillum rhizosphaerae]|uniref:Methyltransferase domain-containing protein n=1 Tax=Herbaspirillum rhizosphaerae TaxID=346179 RepID=A0ABW8ZAP0_9BURK